jgi:hypothetical protein
LTIYPTNAFSKDFFMTIGKPDNGINIGEPDELGSPGDGEDENSTEKEGDDSHLRDDQKSPTFPGAASGNEQ